MFDNLKCDFCKDGRMHYEPEETFKSYFVPETFATDKLNKIIDEAINEYLVFKCRMCGQIDKYTFKDVEKKIRKEMYDIVINSIAIKELRNANTINLIDKTMIYCGKCKGFDGKGACPIKIFKDCKLKRFPSEL
jgi:predicted nucleic-acid-binding Zn-ribbon protein